MSASPNQTIRAALAPKMLLAALILLLPLMVIAALVVDDKNRQIAVVEQDIHGIEYLVQSRTLLDLLTRYFAAAGRGADGGDVGQLRGRIDTLFSDVDRHLTAEGNDFELRPRIAAIRGSWERYTSRADTLDAQSRFGQQNAILEKILELFRNVGNRSGLSALPTVESAYVANLVVRQIPEAVVRLGEISLLQSSSTSAKGAGGAADERHFRYNEWSLALAHNELVRDFHTAISLNPRLDSRLGEALQAFDQQAHRFHRSAVSARGLQSRDARTGGSAPAANARSADAQPADAQPADERAVSASLGGSATDAALVLFDLAVAELELSLSNRLDALRRTKFIALFMVIGASLFATVAGWLLLDAMTRPFQAEIDERKRAEQKARELAAIVESSQDSILVIGLDGIFKSWNRGAERLYGYRADEAVGQPTSLLAPPGLQGETPEAVAAALRNVSTPTLETVRKRKDGSYVDVSLRTSPVYNDEGDVTGIAVIGRDITDRKKAEEELRDKERVLQAHVAKLSQAQNELRAHRDHLEDLVRERTAEVEAQAAQLEEALRKEKEFNALQRKFVSMASHEFRTPLAIIDSSAQRILRRAETLDPEGVRRRVGRIRSAVGRMTTLIESTLSLTRIEEGKVVLNLEPFDIGTLVAEVCGRQQEIAPSHTIRVDLDALPRHIVGDPKLLDQVFTNLLSNAVKYAPGSPQIDVVGRFEDDDIAISVTDRGRGIPEDDLPRLFERYFRASTSHGISGTGIGLNLVKEFVEMHGGEVVVESEVGTRTTFTVHLPVAPPQLAFPDTDARTAKTSDASSVAA